MTPLQQQKAHCTPRIRLIQRFDDKIGRTCTALGRWLCSAYAIVWFLYGAYRKNMTSGRCLCSVCSIVWFIHVRYFHDQNYSPKRILAVVNNIMVLNIYIILHWKGARKASLLYHHIISACIWNRAVRILAPHESKLWF